MAGQARERILVRVWSLNGVDYVRVALAAGVISDFKIMRFDPQGLWKIAGGKSVRVPETIRGLCCILSENSRWRVAIIADGHGAVTRLHPTIEMITHHVTVGACRRIVCKIRGAPGVDKGVQTDPNYQSAPSAEE